MHHPAGPRAFALLACGAASLIAAPAMAAPSPPAVEAVRVAVVPAGSRQEAAVRAALEAMLRQSPPPRTLAEVEAQSQRLTAALRAGGFPLGQVLMTEADWAGAQAGGAAVFTAFPGRVGRIGIENRSRVKDGRLERLLTHALCGRSALAADDACLFRAKRFERATQLLQDLPGAALAGAPRFGPGANAGEVEAVFALAPKGKPWGVDARVDDYGLAATGRTRFTLAARTNNVFGIGDDYAASATVTTTGTWTGSLSGSVPILSDGLRLAASFSRQQYSVIAAGTSFAGISNTGSLGVTYPFARGLDFNMWGAAAYLHSDTTVDYRDFNFSTHGRIDALKLSLTADNGDRPRQLRTSLWSGQAALTIGRQSNDDTLDAGPRRAGTYVKATAAAFGRLTLAQDGDLFVTAGLSGQWASRNLDSSEKLAVGGPYAVRAYRADEGLADAGAVLNLGLYKRFAIARGHQIQIGPVADFAVARVNARPWANWEQGYIGIPGVRNTRKLGGYGAEAAWLTPWGFTLSASAAKPFGFSDGSWVDPGRRPVQAWLSLGWSR